MKKHLFAPLIAFCAYTSIAAASPNMLHPVCMERLLPDVATKAGDAQPKIHDLTQCQSSSQALPYEKLSEFHARFILPENSKNTDLPSFVEYKIVGFLENGQTLVQIISSYGGTMTASSGLIFTDEGTGNYRRVAVNQTIEGGDRCFGGIERLAITAPDTIEIERRITTNEFLLLNTHRKKPVEDVAGCAICCIGVAIEQLKLGEAQTLQRVHLDKSLPATDYSEQQRCFNELTGIATEKQPLVINTVDLKNLQNAFDQDCQSDRNNLKKR